MTCSHPAIVAGKCLVCGASVDAEKQVKKADAVQNAQEPATAAETPENGQETPKKTVRKRKE
jgi:hypothetical protein